MSESKTGHGTDPGIARDLAALVEETGADLPGIGRTVHRARSRAERRAGSAWMRPLFSTLAAVALGAFVAFGLPVSFDKTVGHDVLMTLEGVDAARAAAIAREMKTILGADAVRLEADAADAGVSFRLAASLSSRDGAAVRRNAEALAGALNGAGIAARAEVAPRVERVSGTVVAYAADRVVRIATDGKSDARIETEIRDALAAAGIDAANVSVSTAADGETKVEIGVERHSDSPEPEAVMESIPQIVLTKDGKELGAGDADRAEVRIHKVRRDGGAASLVMDLTKSGRSTTVEVPNVDGMSDAALRDEIQAQLDRAGIGVRVDVLDGKVTVEDR